MLVLDHAKKPAEKVRISGGGRCNFTNLHTAPERFISANPHFAKSALARYTPGDFLDLLERHAITWHEKTLGQLFCDQRAGAIIEMLLAELDAGGGALRLETEVTQIAKSGETYRLSTSAGALETAHLIIATGGLSIPKMGASGFAYKIARQFGHEIITPRAGLVPFVFTGKAHEAFAGISGVSLPVRAEAGGEVFGEAMLFTHRGLSGPAILQISSYWSPGEAILIDLLPGQDAARLLKTAKQERPKQTLGSLLDTHLPARLALMLGQMHGWNLGARLADLPHQALDSLAQTLFAWPLIPVGTEGWRTAEVTVGGIDTGGLSSKTMESQLSSGLYFIGECVDVTGWLGGYNFQWAWASANAAAGAVG